MPRSNLAIKHNIDSENSTVHTLKSTPKKMSLEPKLEYATTHNFMSQFDVKIERNGFFDDLGDFLT